MLLVCQSDKHSTKHGEHICLNECHQHLKQVHEEEHDDTEEIQAQTITYTHRPAKEDDTGEAENNSMTCHHVGKETDHQGKRLGEYAEELDDWHDGGWISLQE